MAGHTDRAVCPSEIIPSRIERDHGHIVVDLFGMGQAGKAAHMQARDLVVAFGHMRSKPTNAEPAPSDIRTSYPHDVAPRFLRR